MASIKISNDPSGRIIVSFPYVPLLVEKVKTMNSRRWHPEGKHWCFLKLNGILEKILAILEDNNVQIDPPFKLTFLKLLQVLSRQYRKVELICDIYRIF